MLFPQKVGALTTPDTEFGILEQLTYLPVHGRMEVD
jgi:hypothetical protein